MRFGYCLPQVGNLPDRDAVLTIARHAERLGYDSLWVLDRLLYPTHPEAPYPPARDGRLPESARRVLDPLAILAFVAAATERVRLGTSVLILPLYNPALLARQLASIDILCSGRLSLGFGTGWAPEEYEAAGVPMAGRGTRAEESLAMMRAMWAGGTVEYRGERYSLAESRIDLLPVQRGGPKVYMAAFVPAALSRAGALSDGWLPAALPIAAMRQMFDVVKEGARSAGRDPQQLELVVRANLLLQERPLSEEERRPFTGSFEQIAADVADIRAAGAHEIHFDGQMTPGVDTVEKHIELMDKLYALRHS